MSEILIAREELNFLLWEWLGLDALLAERCGDAVDREAADAVLDLSTRLAADAFLPHYKAADREEPELTVDGVHALPAIGDALREYAALGLFSAGFPLDRGGMALPSLLANASFAQFLAANVATAAYPMLTTANARLLLAFGTEEQIARFALPQIAGRWFGTMCLSEPQAGSNLADVSTRAVADDTDELGQRYRLTGNKMWISGGDHDLSENIVHLVLAKAVDEAGQIAAGTRGLSLFVVPKLLPSGERNDIAVAGLNHKMGYRGTTNCLLNLGEKGGATGWMVGAPGQGLSQMFQMMNEARIGVALGAAALGYRGWRELCARPGTRAGARIARGVVAADHRASRRPRHAARREMLCRGRAGAGALLREAGRSGAWRRRGRSAARPADADRENLGVRIWPRRQ
jgi:alkylation response protein AidB-like acyl-CoA dehydrogenase